MLSSLDGIQNYVDWGEIVQNYSLTKLTVPRDKLIAISGVAKEFARIMNDEYLAGLWRNQFALCLQWKCLRAAAAGDQPLSYRAPSWSWASVEGEIYTDVPAGGADQVLMTVLNAEIDKVSDDSTGELHDATVQIQCKLNEVDLLRENLEKAVSRRNLEGSVTEFSWDPNATADVGTV